MAPHEQRIAIARCRPLQKGGTPHLHSSKELRSESQSGAPLSPSHTAHKVNRQRSVRMLYPMRSSFRPPLHQTCCVQPSSYTLAWLEKRRKKRAVSYPGRFHQPEASSAGAGVAVGGLTEQQRGNCESAATLWGAVGCCSRAAKLEPSPLLGSGIRASSAIVGNKSTNSTMAWLYMKTTRCELGDQRTTE